LWAVCRWTSTASCPRFSSLVGVSTDRGAGVLVLLAAFMAGQQVIQPMDGPFEGRVHAVCVVGHGDRGLTLRSRLDQASDVGIGGHLSG